MDQLRPMTVVTAGECHYLYNAVNFESVIRAQCSAPWRRAKTLNPNHEVQQMIQPQQPAEPEVSGLPPSGLVLLSTLRFFFFLTRSSSVDRGCCRTDRLTMVGCAGVT